MERTNTKRALQALTLALLSALFYCCADEHDRFDVPVDGKEKLVTFSVRVPGNSSPKTYALTEDGESEVKQIAVLLFKNGKYIYRPMYSNTITTDPDSKTKTFTLKVPEGTYDMVILANANASLNNILDHISVGDEKANVLNGLKLTNEGKWETKSTSGNYKPIPMWGEKSNIIITSGMGKVEATLLRMVSKIDVSLTTKAQKNFELTSVYLYNYNSKGQIIPSADALNESKTEVSKPTVLGNPTKGPLQYDKDAITKDLNTHKGSSCINEIYTFEATAGTAGDLSQNTCLVIGGRYQNDTNETFYRIDFANTADGAITYLPLLRNNQYRVDVQSISGPGLPTTEQAFNSRPVNIKASILNWSDGRFTEFDVNGQYFVGVSQGKYTFSKEERGDKSSDNILSILTNHPDGWKIEITDKDGKITNYSWLECSSTKGVANKAADVRLKLGKNDSERPRTAYVHVKAGRLDYIVEVTQLNTFQKGIIITQDSKETSKIEFTSSVDGNGNGALPASQTLNIRWYPSTTDLKCSSFNIENEIKFTGPQVLPSTGYITRGDTTLTIQPTAILKEDLDKNPFYQRKSLYLYTVSDGVATINKTLTVSQFVYNAIPVKQDFYFMNGKQQTFGVRANYPFEVIYKSGPKGVISNIKTSGTPNTSDWGTPVTFDIVDGTLTTPNLTQQDVVLAIHSTSGTFPDKEFTLKCITAKEQPESNSYMMTTSGAGILIPVSRANASSRVGTQLNDKDAFTAELVWTDNTKGVTAASNVSMIKAIGTGFKGHVLVMPGSIEGNAVVAIKNTNGQILWSWHIWVTKVMPQMKGKYKFMDRNLGALGNITEPSDVRNRGLFYQWGRKDPLPSQQNSGSGFPIYDSKGNQIQVSSKTAKGDAVAHTIANPINFASEQKYNDWCIPQDNYLWKSSEKTIYDPCPYGWRIPADTKVWFQDNKDKWTGTRSYNQPFYGGYTNENYGGFYPAAGFYRQGSYSFLTAQEMWGGYWASNTFNNNGRLDGHMMSFSYSGTDFDGTESTASEYRASGVSVRCIKYDEK